jgi:uncharacterized SAM-binding protein YcdF (DUF218 family)
MSAAVDYYRSSLSVGVDPTIVVTGGHGDHFNRAPRPHRDYANDELVKRGTPREVLIAEGLLSSNTVEDALVILDFIAQQGMLEAVVVTSCFHVPRTRLIFACVMPSYRLSFLAADDPPNLDPSSLAHEESATALIRVQGGVRYGARFRMRPTTVFAIAS